MNCSPIKKSSVMGMKSVLLVIIFCFSALACAQTPSSPAQIREQMAKIRQTTNWDDPASAEKANAEIKRLAKMLMMGSGRQNDPAAGTNTSFGSQNSGNNSNDARELAEINEAMVDQKMDIYSQIWKAAAGGEGADILLAEPLREEIVNEYREDETRKPVPFVAEELEVMVIDMSMRGIQAIIDMMPIYKSVRTLIITSSQNPVPVDLQKILKNAAGYPLKELYIVNLGVYVTTLPKEITQYPGLNTLGIFNNMIRSLPSGITNMQGLRKLYADNNPLTTTMPVLGDLPNLTELGLVNTEVPDSEIEMIKSMHPSCKVLTR
jgi:Leucine-rich repeat (LRR) protein